MTSLKPLARVVITGSPHASASRAGVGKRIVNARQNKNIRRRIDRQKIDNLAKKTDARGFKPALVATAGNE